MNGQITIKSYTGFDDLDVVVIPDRINDLLVTKIDEKHLKIMRQLKSYSTTIFRFYRQKSILPLWYKNDKITR